MKHLLIALACLLPLSLSAQKTEGRIVFEEAREIEFEMEGLEGMDEIKKMMADAARSKMVLLFREDEALYRKFDPEEDGDKEIVHEGGGARVVMVMSSANSAFYHDLETNKTVERTDFMGKTFLIKGEGKAYPWKLAGETKEILGYGCQKATYVKDDSITYEAWFTPEIPVASGPNGFSGLPGMILEISRNGKEWTATAQEIEFGKQGKKAIVAPKSGKEVTREEYHEIV